MKTAKIKSKARGRRNKKASYQTLRERSKEERWAFMLTNALLIEEHKKWLHDAPESAEFLALEEQRVKRGLPNHEPIEASDGPSEAPEQ